MRTLTAIISLCLFLTIGSRGYAAPGESDDLPIESLAPELSVIFTADLGTMRFVGDAAQESSWSFSSRLRQGVGYGAFIAWLSLGSETWLTYQEAPPLQYGMRAFSVSLAVGAQIPFDKLRLGVAVASNMYNLAETPLYSTMGSHIRYHTLGGAAFVGWTGLSPLYVETRAEVHHWFSTVRPTQSVQILLSIGIRIQKK